MTATHITSDLRNSVEGMLRRIASTSWCRGCKQIVDLITVNEAAALAGSNHVTVLLWVMQERVHCLEMRGRLLICATSLERREAVTGELNRARR